MKKIFSLALAAGKLKYTLLSGCMFLFLSDIPAQIQFKNKTGLLTPAQHFSGVAIAVLDMNGDGLDDIARMNRGYELAVEYQTEADQPFRHISVGELPNDGSQWGICAADLDNNGFSDILAGGEYDGIKIALANADGSAFDVSLLDAPATFAQCVNFADINNDGWLDAFVCHDDGASRIFGNDGAGNLTYQPGWINLATVPASNNSGNYGSVWSDVDNDGDLDLYIAKCRQGVSDPNDPTRINQLFLNNGDGTYTQDTINTSGLRIGAQSWTADFGDIDNDGDFDCFITNHDVSSQLLENDGAGHFTDISAAAGIHNTVGGLPIQGIFRDFDNDGFVDILVAGTQHYLLRNNGDKTFSEIPGLFDDNQMESFAIGDLNHDGFQDIYAGYANIFTSPGFIPDALWINEGNDNNFLGFNLRGKQSNRNAVGAKVLLYSAFGTQIREVRSGESYGIMNSMQIHFGLGQLTQVDSVVIYWPSGAGDVLKQLPGINQYFTVEEGGCIVPQVLITASGVTAFCSGDSVTLATAGGFAAYQWSNGDSKDHTVAKSAGNYTVTVTNAEGCTAVSNIITVVVDPVEIPTIIASGDTIFCAGGSVTLMAASSSATYTWSTGEATPAIVVAQTGAYTVTTQGLCAPYTSAPQTVAVLDNPVPVVTADTVPPNSAAVLTATGTHVLWYDSPTGGIPLFSGNSYVTPALSETTTYWLSNITTYNQPSQFTGMAEHQGSSFGDAQFNGAIIFDCFKPFRLATVKVYANVPAERKIDLRNAQGEVLQSKTVFIPDGITTIALDLDVPAGGDLVLTTDETVNQINLGSNGPQLRRSSQGVNYPYEIPGVVSIKNSNFGPDRYYYFYNWEVDFHGYECVSERVAVTAVVDPTLFASAPAPAAGLHLFPNPVSGVLTAEISDFAGGEIRVSIKNAQGISLKTHRIEAFPGKFSFHLDLSSLPGGSYWLELGSAQGVVRRKVIVLGIKV